MGRHEHLLAVSQDRVKEFDRILAQGFTDSRLSRRSTGAREKFLSFSPAPVDLRDKRLSVEEITDCAWR